MMEEPEDLGSFITFAYHPNRGVWVVDLGTTPLLEAKGLLREVMKKLDDEFESGVRVYCNGASIDDPDHLEDEEDLDDSEEDS